MTFRSRLSDFKLMGKLGQGSYGVVWKVVRKHDSTTYALKEVNLSCLNRKEQEACVREVHVLARLDNPYIVKYFDCFIENDKLYMVTEYAGGGTLHEYIQAEGAPGLPEATVWRLLIQIASALNHMHSQSMLHRDVKSMNVFLAGTQCTAKLGDLGVAKVLASRDGLAQTLVGTPYFLSPELCSGQAYNDRSDVWALGVVLYECCTGRYPFRGSNQAVLIMRILNGKHPAIPAAKYSAELRGIVEQCLGMKSRERPSCADLLARSSVKRKARELGLAASLARPSSPLAVQGRVVATVQRSPSLKLPGHCEPATPIGHSGRIGHPRRSTAPEAGVIKLSGNLEDIADRPVATPAATPNPAPVTRRATRPQAARPSSNGKDAANAAASGNSGATSSTSMLAYSQRDTLNERVRTSLMSASGLSNSRVSSCVSSCVSSRVSSRISSRASGESRLGSPPSLSPAHSTPFWFGGVPREREVSATHDSPDLPDSGACSSTGGSSIGRWQHDETPQWPAKWSDVPRSAQARGQGLFHSEEVAEEALWRLASGADTEQLGRAGRSPELGRSASSRSDEASSELAGEVSQLSMQSETGAADCNIDALKAQITNMVGVNNFKRMYMIMKRQWTSDASSGVEGDCVRDQCPQVLKNIPAWADASVLMHKVLAQEDSIVRGR